MDVTALSKRTLANSTQIDLVNRSVNPDFGVFDGFRFMDFSLSTNV